MTDVDDRKRSSGMVITLLALAFASLAANQWHNRQSIEHTSTVGATALSEESIQRVLGTCLEQQRRHLMLSDVRDSIEQIPFIRSASVYFSAVRGVTAEVVERTPVAHVVMQDGSLRYVDAEGVILPKTGRCMSNCIPLLRTSDLSHVPSLVNVLVQARNVLNPNLFSAISEIVESSDGNVRVLADNVTWFLGDPEEDQARHSFADMNVFWDRAVRGQSLAQYAEIDLRWKHHVVIRHGNKATRS